ncbi:Hypothetical predicted protein [Mytilus galloprovincialis]|uniref:Reverse transcriptase domain-containing protein n=1 Tax=Mytilus galloprovincialis TaxID=29158 RepID=A0A8B6H661_MYTGA|nr:Hypothetical predicted protein [Mytilus galloprovincialis]
MICQYRDDGFMITECNKSQIDEFFAIANNIDPLLKFTYNFSNTEVTYLDTEVYKGERFKSSGVLDIRLHVKPTETYQYLPITSAHPKHTFRSIITGWFAEDLRVPVDIGTKENGKNLKPVNKITSTNQERFEKNLAKKLIARSISKIVNKLFTNKEIDEHTYNFLRDCKNPKHGYMYLLPKIHKIRQDSLETIKIDGYKIGELDVPFRPIINKCNSPTRRIEKFLVLILKPLLRKLEFYIQDTKDFINRIESKTCVRSCTLIAYDVTSMYTNMNIDNLLDTTKNFLDQIDRTKYKFKVPNKSDLISFAKIILENNEFIFNGTLYKQVIGAPQGGILSPTATDLHLSTILTKILDKFQFKNSISMICQYRDDGFMITECNKSQIDEFFAIANNIDPLLKFTYNFSNT